MVKSSISLDACDKALLRRLQAIGVTLDELRNDFPDGARLELRLPEAGGFL
jgi:hypothetical protein